MEQQDFRAKPYVGSAGEADQPVQEVVLPVLLRELPHPEELAGGKRHPRLVISRT